MKRRPNKPHAGGKDESAAPTISRDGLPSKEALLAWLKTRKSPATPKDIARAFNVKGKARRDLHILIKQLRTEGIVGAPGKKAVALDHSVPDSGLFEMVGLNDDGEAIARAMGKEGPYGPTLIINHRAASHTASHSASHGRAPQAGRAKPAAIPALGLGDRFIGKVRDVGQEDLQVNVIKVLGAMAEKLWGIFVAESENPLSGGRFLPSDKKARGDFLVLAQHRNEAENGALVAVRLLPQRGYGPRKVEILESFGHKDDPRAASILAIAEHKIPMGFSPAEVAQAEAAQNPSLGNRLDLRTLPLLTIDPEDARDHDDAVYAEPLKGGGFRLYVAIADVAHFVSAGSPLDAGAAKRGNSVYFPDRVVPMLPERLSADLCSLVEGEDRACLVAIIEIDQEGQPKNRRFARGLMRSWASLSYEQVQAAMDGRIDDACAPLMDNALRPLWAAHDALTKARNGREPLNITSLERKIKLDENGNVVSIQKRESLRAHRVIEDMMIAANVAAAQALDDKRAPLIYRIHDRPSETKVAALADFLSTLDYKWAKGEAVTAARFNRLQERAAGTEQADMINEMVLRSQSQAIYDTENIGHFGLNLRQYAHFTSPIRRYADVCVHRALIAALGLGDDGHLEPHAKLKKIAEAITNCERRAVAAERDATERYIAHFLSERIGAKFAGRITGVTKFGLFIKLEETGADGLAPAAGLGHEYFVHDELGQRLVGQESGDQWVLGMPVEVRLLEAVPVNGGLILELTSQPKAGRPISQHRVGRRPHKGGSKHGGPPKNHNGNRGAGFGRGKRR